MNKIIFKIIRYSGLPLIFREIIQKDKVTIILFHDLSPTDADKVFSYLSNKYNIISLKDFVDSIHHIKNFKIPPKALILTFDDGHKGNYELLPILKKYNLPATIFLCAGIVGTNRHYWFKHASLKFNVESLKNKSNTYRLSVLREIGFEQTKEYPKRQALSYEEIEEMKNFVDFQSHTLFHPSLPHCNNKEAWSEINESKKLLERKLNKKIYAIAYPFGEYSARDIELCKKAGYMCGVTVDFGFNTIWTDPFRLKRLSLRDTGDINEISVKASGVWAFLKKYLLENFINKIRGEKYENRDIIS